mmetsp:Transcript_40433/g.59949  ORF Transcript_40433/g.59949 Transcript_40433/m.59949 type:complete len:97 (+) Transcript_40433:850-1140(+)
MLFFLACNGQGRTGYVSHPSQNGKLERPRQRGRCSIRLFFLILHNMLLANFMQKVTTGGIDVTIEIMDEIKRSTSTIMDHSVCTCLQVNLSFTIPS